MSEQFLVVTTWQVPELDAKSSEAFCRAFQMEEPNSHLIYNPIDNLLSIAIVASGNQHSSPGAHVQVRCHLAFIAISGEYIESPLSISCMKLDDVPLPADHADALATVRSSAQIYPAIKV